MSSTNPVSSRINDQAQYVGDFDYDMLRCEGRYFCPLITVLIEVLRYPQPRDRCDSWLVRHPGSRRVLLSTSEQVTLRNGRQAGLMNRMQYILIRRGLMINILFLHWTQIFMLILSALTCFNLDNEGLGFPITTRCLRYDSYHII